MVYINDAKPPQMQIHFWNKSVGAFVTLEEDLETPIAIFWRPLPPVPHLRRVGQEQERRPHGSKRSKR